MWIPIKDGDLRAYGLYRKHYSYRSRTRIYHRQIAPPCEHQLLLTPEQNALWLWTAERWRKDGQEGINCAIFRNEGHRLSSDLVLAAEDWGQQRWPGQRMFTYVDGSKIASANPGYCFKKAGWRKCGESKRGLTILEKYPDW